MRTLVARGHVNSDGMQIDFVAKLKGGSEEMASFDDRGFVPVYLPDRTVIGRAQVNPDGTLNIEFRDDAAFMKELFDQSMVGLSVFAREAFPAEVLYETTEPKKEGEEDG
jgi:hypothetical protein